LVGIARQFVVAHGPILTERGELLKAVGAVLGVVGAALCVVCAGSGARPTCDYALERMGQPVTVIEKPSSQAGVVRFEINRTLTGMGHERYRPDRRVEGNRPPDELARRLFERGGIESIHINSNVITLDLAKGADSAGLAEIIGDLYTYYRPGVEVPTPESFGAPAE